MKDSHISDHVVCEVVHGVELLLLHYTFLPYLYLMLLLDMLPVGGEIVRKAASIELDI